MPVDILLVDDDPDAIQMLGRILEGIGSFRFATSGEDALRLARTAAPDLILLDAEMAGISGFQVLQALKSETEMAEVPVIFVTGHSDPAFEVAGFDLGAADFIAKPVSAPLILARVKTQLRVKRMADELRRISNTDPLTGVANRRRFDGYLAQEWHRARRTADPLALLMLDVDHFKAYNDHYGHPAGDACLRAVARALLGAGLRPADLVARYGGEEFVMLLPQTPRGGAEHVARTVLEAVASLAIPHAASGTAAHVSVSVGIACCDDYSWTPALPGALAADERQTGWRPEDLLEAADKALYCAKNSGRAHARWLAIADRSTPERAQRIAVSSRHEAAAAVAVPPSDAATPGKVPLKGIRVLAVDDNNLDMMKLLLELEGAQVALANHGLEAVDMIQATPDGFDVVLMDVQMPVLDGHAATRRIRMELGLWHLPIIGLTGDTLGATRDVHAGSVMDEYIGKPFEPKNLVQCILRHVALWPGPPRPERDGAPPVRSGAVLSWREIEGIDSDDARGRLMDDFGLFLGILGRVLHEFRDIGAPGPMPDHTALSGLAKRMHRLAGSAGMLGATQVLLLARKVEAACAAGEAELAMQWIAPLAVALQQLDRSAAPVLAAAETDRGVPPPDLSAAGEPAVHELGKLLAALRQQSLSALDHFQRVNPLVRKLLDPDTFERLCQRIDKLQFAEAALTLEAIPGSMVRTRGPASPDIGGARGW